MVTDFLVGWKAIADAFGISIDLAQRWHRAHGMPVVILTRRATLDDELDAPRRSRRGRAARGIAFTTLQALNAWGTARACGASADGWVSTSTLEEVS